MKKLLCLNFILMAFTSIAIADTKKVVIYFVPWDVMTATAMTAEGVRKSAEIKTEITDPWYARAYVKWLGEDKMKAVDQKNQVADLRLVVDAIQENGSIHTFYASRFAICSEHSGKVRAIDEAFRSQFEFFYKK